jgi:hypothetical protein
MIRCINLRRYEKNTLRAFVDLELSRVGPVLGDCTWHQKDGQEWISFPARSYQGLHGVTRWQPLIEFAASAKQEREAFRHQTLEAIRQYAAQNAEVAS